MVPDATETIIDFTLCEPYISVKQEKKYLRSKPATFRFQI